MNRNKTVLVISDSYEQFASTASLLRDDGYYFRFEKEVSGGLSLAGAEAPYLIISELAVPNVDGLQLCRRLRDDHSLGTIPILLVGDLSKQSSIVTDGFRCGAAEYVQKPIDPSQLADMCRSILSPKRDKPLDLTDRPVIDQSFSPPEVIYSRVAGENVVCLDQVIKNDILRALIFDNASVGLALFSSTGQLIESNRELLQLLDYSEAQLLDLTLSEFVIPYDFEIDKQAIEEVILGERSHYKFKNGYLTPLGARVWGQLTIVNIPDPDNDTHFLIGIFEDPTNQYPDRPALSDGDHRATIQVSNSTIPGMKPWKIDKRLFGIN